MLTPEQMERRVLAIGASEVAAVLGVSRYSSAWKVWARKLGLLAAEPTTWDMQRGTTMEPQILAWYEAASGATLQRPDTLYHASSRVILAHLDALAVKGEERWNVEAKDVKGRMARWWGEPGSDEIDPEYYPQVLVQMEVAGLPFTEVAVSLGGDEPTVYRVPRNERLGGRIVRRLCSWWDRHVIGQEPPGVDSSEDARIWLESLYSERRGLMLEATEEIEALAQERRAIVVQLERQEERRAEIENFFRSIIADAEGIEGAFGKVTWRADKNGRRNLRFKYTKEE